MNKAKRIVSIILVLIMCLSTTALTGCFKKDADKGNVITWLVPASKQNDLALVLDEVNKIVEPAIGAKLEIVLIDQSAYNQRMNMNMAAGNDFDICFTSSWLNNYYLAAQRDGIMSIDELLEKCPDLKESIPDYAWEAVKVNGKIYGVPNMQIMTSARCYYVLKRLADKYGLDVENASTPDDIEEFLGKVKAGEPKIYPYRNNNGCVCWVLPKYEPVSNDVYINRAKPESDLIINPPEMLEGNIKLHEWFKKGYIREDFVSMGDDTADLYAGKYAVWGDNYMPGGEAKWESIIGEPVVALKPWSPITIDTTSATGAILSIGKNSKNPEKAMKFLELLNTNKEVYRLIAYGIEGKHYKLDKDGRLEYIENSGYAFKEPWKFGNTFNGYPLVGQDLDVFEQTIAFNESATVSPMLGFVPDLTKIETELANISNVSSGHSIYNEDPRNFWDEVIKLKKDAGFEKVRKELDKQYKEFLKTKKK